MTYTNLIPTHGGYRQLRSFQTATIVYDAEGSMASGTSKKTEIKLIGVARASLEELLLDYEDYLREHQLELWSKEDSRVKEIRALSYTTNKSYSTYTFYLSSPESAANCLICLIHQANYLLDQQLRTLEKEL